eukprot:1153532-Prymnesium_polylepis.1
MSVLGEARSGAIRAAGWRGRTSACAPAKTSRAQAICSSSPASENPAAMTADDEKRITFVL